MVSLFERYAKGGDNAKLKDWALKTLPHLHELAFGVSAFADNNGTGVHPGAEGRYNIKLATVVGREASQLAFNREETQDAARIARGIGSNRPT